MEADKTKRRRNVMSDECAIRFLGCKFRAMESKLTFVCDLCGERFGRVTTTKALSCGCRMWEPGELRDAINRAVDAKQKALTDK